MIYDGIISVTDSSGNALEREWVYSGLVDHYSTVYPNDSLIMNIVFPIHTWYNLTHYGAYNIQLKYTGNIPEEYSNSIIWKDSAIVSNEIQIKYIK